MTRDQLLSARANNLLAGSLGMIVLGYVIYAITSATWSEQNGFLGLVIISGAFCVIVEGHTTLRLAWEKRKAQADDSIKAGAGIQLFRLVYNAAWILPIVLAFAGAISFATGFIVFLSVTVFRLIANIYMNTALTWEQAELFLFRS